jgi:hypothetical protein
MVQVGATGINQPLTLNIYRDQRLKAVYPD